MQHVLPLWPEWIWSYFTLDFHEFEWTIVLNTTSWSKVPWDKYNNILMYDVWMQNKQHKWTHPPKFWEISWHLLKKKPSTNLEQKSGMVVRISAVPTNPNAQTTELKVTCLSHCPSITSIWKVCGCNACSLSCFVAGGFLYICHMQYPNSNWSQPILRTLLGANRSHLWKRNIIFPPTFKANMLVPWRVYTLEIWGWVLLVSHISFARLPWIHARIWWCKSLWCLQGFRVILNSVPWKCVGKRSYPEDGFQVSPDYPVSGSWYHDSEVIFDNSL